MNSGTYMETAESGYIESPSPQKMREKGGISRNISTMETSSKKNFIKMNKTQVKTSKILFI
jgi:hypothetical protein